MTAAALMAELRARGVTLVADGELLRCRPKSALTVDDLAALKAHKATVLALLRQGDGPRVVCYWCCGTHFWRSIHGVVVCADCHAPPAPDLVAEWIDEGQARGAAP